MKEPGLREHLKELLALGNSTAARSKSKIVASAAQK
jgi:hypothetical protein